MIKFKWNKVDKKHDNTPVIKDVELDNLAEMLLKDYKPKLLNEPSKIKYQNFLESYLGANIDFQHIYYEENQGRIFGVTAFNDEYLKVFDKDNSRIGHMKLRRNTVVLDYYVMEEDREGLEIFTGLHEAGHLWLHPEVYTKCQNQLSLFGDENELKPVVCCRRGDIQSFGRRKISRTPEEWREHQADYFASALAMPKVTFVPFALETLKDNGIRDGRVILDGSYNAKQFAEYTLPEIVRKPYGVSRTAAYVRLRKLGIIIDKKQYEQEKSQMSIVF